jgi:hypothetical protein
LNASSVQGPGDRFVLSFDARLPAADIVTHGMVLVVIDERVVIQPLDRISVSRYSDPHFTLGYMETGSFVVLDFTDLVFQFNSRMQVHLENVGDYDEEIFCKANFKELPEIGYGASFRSYENSGEISIIPLLSNGLNAYYYYSDYFPSEVRWFLDISGLALDYAYNFGKFAIWKYGHADKLFEDLSFLGIEEGFAINSSPSLKFLSFEDSISFPFFNQDNISAIFDLRNINLRLGVLNSEDYQFHSMASIITRNTSNYFQFEIILQDPDENDLAKFITNLNYFYDIENLLVLTQEYLFVGLMNKVLFSTDLDEYIPLPLLSSSPTFEPTIGPLPHVLNEWQFCHSYWTQNTYNATAHYKYCLVTACPGETMTISLCNTDSQHISVDGDSYLRLRSRTDSSYVYDFNYEDYYGNVTEYASNDDGCGLASRIVYTVNASVDSCMDYEIIEGCYSTGYCSGRVGVLLTTNESVPSMQPTTVLSPTADRNKGILPRAVDTWQKYRSYTKGIVTPHLRIADLSLVQVTMWCFPLVLMIMIESKTSSDHGVWISLVPMCTSSVICRFTVGTDIALRIALATASV